MQSLPSVPALFGIRSGGDLRGDPPGACAAFQMRPVQDQRIPFDQDAVNSGGGCRAASSAKAGQSGAGAKVAVSHVGRSLTVNYPV